MGLTTPLHEAASSGDVDKVRDLLEGGKYDVNCVDGLGYTPLHWAADRGHLGVVRVLTSEFKADVNAHDNLGETPLHMAANRGHLPVVRMLISEFKADVNAHDNLGETPLHMAALRGHCSMVKVLISQFKANVNAQSNNGGTALHMAANSGYLDVVKALVSEFKADVNACTVSGETALHIAAHNGHLYMVKALVSEFKADVNACTNTNITAFEIAVNSKNDKLALALLNEGHCDTKGGTPYIQTACERGWVNLVRALVHKHGTGILKPSVTLFHDITVKRWREVAVIFLEEFGLSVQDRKGRSLLHIACEEGDISLVRTLINDGKADTTLRDSEGRTPFDIAVNNSPENLALVLMNEFHCDTNGGSPYIHTACERGWVNLVQALVEKHGTGILMKAVSDHSGWSLLHLACSYNSAALVRFLSQHISPWVVDNNGDTPLHICARLGRAVNIRILLKLDPPVMIRNNLGQTPKDVEDKYGGIYRYIASYMEENKDKIDRHYKLVQKHAKKKYSLPEPITRAFVLGNPGAGKSSLVEALKREGFVDSFKRVSESSVPPHTAGIVPSIHTSKHYGRVMFYDFAGDAEYYSSHSAILENLASSRKGDNVFLLVVDMREEMAEIKKIFHYWLSFIQHHQFHGQLPHLMVVGSHLDLLTEDMAKARGEEFQMFCDSIDTGGVQMSALTILDCCKPRSRQISGLQTHMSSLTMQEISPP